MSRFHNFTSRLLERRLTPKKDAKNPFKRTARSFEHQPTAEANTSRFFHTKIASKRSACKFRPTQAQFRLTKHKYLSLKRRIQWNKTRPSSSHHRRVPSRPRHARSLHRVVSKNNLEESGYEIMSLDETRFQPDNLLYNASRILPLDLLRHVYGFLETETFWSLPAVNRRIYYLFSPAQWKGMAVQRVDNIVQHNLDALWGYSCRRSRITPCWFGRELSMQSCRAVVLFDGMLLFCGNEVSGRRLSFLEPVMMMETNKVTILFDRLFDFGLYFSSLQHRTTPESAFRISSIGRAQHATRWQKMVLKRFVAALAEANCERAPTLMGSSNLGANPFTLPACLE